MLQTRLIGIMKRELESLNLVLSQSGLQQLEQLVSYGIQRMRTSNALDNAGLILQAERNVRFLIRYLGDYARSAGTYPRLNDSDFSAAMLASPTFWPYCCSS